MSSNDTKWIGSRWWRFDFHTHTPASCDYGKGPQQETFAQISPRDWLLDFMRAKIDCVAVTDHNSGAWVDLLKMALQELAEERPPDFRPLTLFPGVEISVNGGVHILAIFAPDCSTSDIDSLLGAVGFNGAKGSSDSVTSKTIPEVIKTVSERGGIAIPAHVDGPNGLFEVVHGTTLQQVLECSSIFAMEVVNAGYTPPQLYQDAKLQWTTVVGSDSHHPAQSSGTHYPGSHFTWVKMEEPSLDGLRLALLDGDEGWSTKRSDVNHDDPNRHADLVIESLEVHDARYLGRRELFEVQFSPWLTTIIGGRGTGKSTLVEFLRTVMRREGELPDQLKDDFAKYQRVYQNRQDDGLLTANTQLRAVYRKDGVQFRIQWNQTGDLAAIEEKTSTGEWRVTDGEVNRRFPVRIYSQKQVYQLASRPSALLNVIDDAPQIAFVQWAEQWVQLNRTYLSLRARARELSVSPNDESTLRGELDDVLRRLSVFEDAGQADVLREYQRRQQQKRAVENWEKSWENAGSQIQAFANDVVPESLDLRPDQPDIEGVAEKVRQKMDNVATRLRSLAEDVDAISQEWNQSRQNSGWARAVQDAENTYRQLRDRLESQGEKDPSAYGALVQRRQQIEERLVDVQHRRSEAEKVEQQAAEVLSELRKWRSELTQRRQQFLSEVLDDNEYITIDVVPFGATDTVEQEVRRLLRRDGDQAFERDLGAPRGAGLLGELYPEAYSHEATTGRDAVETRLENLKAALKRIASGDQAPRDLRFATHLASLPPETFDHIDTWFPGDSVDVKYRASSGNNTFRSIQEGSPGQKTSALLAFLLSYGTEPLILDQPEDDLDNRLIYDLIVAQLRVIKSRRQVVVVTHNPNIVVNGDAELVTALEPRGGETQVECAASLQSREVRDVVCAIMEGGRQAFDRRYHRIALEMGRD